jgi:hypothetical protein
MVRIRCLDKILLLLLLATVPMPGYAKDFYEQLRERLQEDDWLDQGGCVIDYGGHRKLVECDSEEFTGGWTERKGRQACRQNIKRLGNARIQAKNWVDEYDLLKNRCLPVGEDLPPMLWKIVSFRPEKWQVLAEQKWCLEGTKCKTIRRVFKLSDQIIEVLQRGRICSSENDVECFSSKFSSRNAVLSGFEVAGNAVVIHVVGPIEYRYAGRSLQTDCDEWIKVPAAEGSETHREARSCKITKGAQYNLEHLILASAEADLSQYSVTRLEVREALQADIPGAVHCGGDFGCTEHKRSQP